MNENEEQYFRSGCLGGLISGVVVLIFTSSIFFDIQTKISDLTEEIQELKQEIETMSLPLDIYQTCLITESKSEYCKIYTERLGNYQKQAEKLNKQAAELEADSLVKYFKNQEKRVANPRPVGQSSAQNTSLAN